MRRRTLPTLALTIIFLFLAATAPSSARADEDDDIQRQIDTLKANVPDLERLDSRRAAAVEIQHLKDWLSLAWELRSKHEPDQAREVIDRCLAQGELIRQLIAAADLRSQVADREAKLKRTRDEIVSKRRALQDAQVKKKTLEPSIGQ